MNEKLSKILPSYAHTYRIIIEHRFSFIVSEMFAFYKLSKQKLSHNDLGNFDCDSKISSIMMFWGKLSQGEVIRVVQLNEIDFNVIDYT